MSPLRREEFNDQLIKHHDAANDTSRHRKQDQASLATKANDVEEGDSAASLAVPVPIVALSHHESASVAKSEFILSPARRSSIKTARRKGAATINHAAKAGRYLGKLWVGLTLPVVILTWFVTQSIPVVVFSAFVPFSIAFLQGFIGMLRYRKTFSDSPIPKALSHGVLKCTSKSIYNQRSSISKLGGDIMETPLRLLLIGDSLAVGVGQNSSSTPIMPETIAKELSKEMRGRPVMWTCHGAPGASTGWIIRELEQSLLKHGQFEKDDATVASSPSDDSSFDSISSEQGEETETWVQRLRQQRIQFDPKVLAPFDIAVVLTGSNDLKNACFPFLVKQDDTDTDTQTPKHSGSDYGKELQRLLQVLDQRMRLRLQTLRESVEAASERVRESVDTAVDRTLGRDSSFRRNRANADDSSPATHQPKRELSLSRSHSSCVTSLSSGASENMDLMRQSLPDYQRNLFPMVVLPGMPADSLPAFDLFPLRHLAIPMIGIMDAHKRDLAGKHDGEVLFVDAPAKEDLAEFSCQKGQYWDKEIDDLVMLNVHDIEQKHKRRIKDDMKKYYSDARTSFDCNPPKRKQHFSTISVDGVHPNDTGYNFWGRYIGSAIISEWRRKQQECVIPIV